MYFLFIVGGCVGIVVGAPFGRKWIRNPWFRLSHAAAVYIVIFGALAWARFSNKDVSS